MYINCETVVCVCVWVVNCKNDWGQIEALQNQNMGGSGSAKAIIK